MNSERSVRSSFELCHSDAVKTIEYRRLVALQLLTESLMQCTSEHEYGSAQFRQILSEAMSALDAAQQANPSAVIQKLAKKFDQS